MSQGHSSFDARLDTVPTNPGVYLMKDASGSVIYVGKAKNLKNRLSQYFSGAVPADNKVRAMLARIADYDYIVVGSELEALLLEANLIKRYQPYYNVLLRDDKGFPYACVTMHEEYPRIIKAFRIGADREKGARYFGPFLGGDLYHALEALKEILPTKKCRKILPRDIGKGRPCLNYHIGKCVAPCKGDVSASEYRAVMEKVCGFFEGRYDGIQKEIIEEMQSASDELDFERAAIHRDRLQALEKLMASQSVSFRMENDMDAIGLYRDGGEICIRKLELRSGRIVGSSTYFIRDEGEPEEIVLKAFITQYYSEKQWIPPVILVNKTLEDHALFEKVLAQYVGRKVTLRVPKRGDAVKLLQLAHQNAREALVRRILRVGDSGASIQSALETLREYLGLDVIPNRIEAYDISNLGLDDQCGAMVVFVNGRPQRKNYRLFKIKKTQFQDDYAAMCEVIQRRFSRKDQKEWDNIPDLVLIDGGKGHISVVSQALEELGVKVPCIAGMVKNARHKTSGIMMMDGTKIDLDEKACRDEKKLVLLRLMTAIQNEVHRFAITYQRKLSKKRHLSFRLESIPGIGPAKRRALLSHFGTIGKIAQAKPEDIVEVKGISEKDAYAVFRHFHLSEEE